MCFPRARNLGLTLRLPISALRLLLNGAEWIGRANVCVSLPWSSTSRVRACLACRRLRPHIYPVTTTCSDHCDCSTTRFAGRRYRVCPPLLALLPHLAAGACAFSCCLALGMLVMMVGCLATATPPGGAHQCPFSLVLPPFRHRVESANATTFHHSVVQQPILFLLVPVGRGVECIGNRHRHRDCRPLSCLWSCLAATKATHCPETISYVVKRVRPFCKASRSDSWRNNPLPQQAHPACPSPASTALVRRERERDIHTFYGDNLGFQEPVKRYCSCFQDPSSGRRSSLFQPPPYPASEYIYV
jgi:hypothetical protein